MTVDIDKEVEFLSLVMVVYLSCDHYIHFFFLQEEKKVMFYFPDDADIDTKVKNVGLAEAIVQFAS